MGWCVDSGVESNCISDGGQNFRTMDSGVPWVLDSRCGSCVRHVWAKVMPQACASLF